MKWVTEQVLDEVIEERRKQDLKWGEQNHNFTMWLSIFLEELGEASKNYNEGAKTEEIRTELIQAASVLIAWIENIDRNGSVE